MGKPEIQALVATLSSDTVPEGTFNRNLSVAMRSLAEGSARLRAEVVELAAGQATVQIPLELFTPAAAYFYDATQLCLAAQQELRAAYGPSWRSAQGAPVAYVLEQESEGVIRLFPVPQMDTQLPIVPLWSPIGADYAIGGLLVIAAEFGDQPDRMLDWLDLWAALAVLGRSLAEDSPTQDLEVGGAATQLADALGSALGV